MITIFRLRQYLKWKAIPRWIFRRIPGLGNTRPVSLILKNKGDAVLKHLDRVLVYQGYSF